MGEATIREGIPLMLTLVPEQTYYCTAMRILCPDGAYSLCALLAVVLIHMQTLRHVDHLRQLLPGQYLVCDGTREQVNLGAIVARGHILVHFLNYRPLRAKTPPPKRGPVAKLHAQILARLGPAPVAEDQLIRDLQVPSSDVAPALLDLEMEGEIQRQPGGLLSRSA